VPAGAIEQDPKAIEFGDRLRIGFVPRLPSLAEDSSAELLGDLPIAIVPGASSPARGEPRESGVPPTPQTRMTERFEWSIETLQ